MKKVIAGIIFAVLLSFTQILMASEETHKKTTEELINVMGIRDMENQSFDQLKQVFMSQMDPMFQRMEDKKTSQSIKEKVTVILNKELSWGNLKSEYIKLYMETFTEEEMKVIISFYKTPEGQKLMDKIPEIMDRSLQIGEKKVTGIMPGIGDMIKGAGNGMQGKEKNEMPKDSLHMKKH